MRTKGKCKKEEEEEEEEEEKKKKRRRRRRRREEEEEEEEEAAAVAAAVYIHRQQACSPRKPFNWMVSFPRIVAMTLQKESGGSPSLRVITYGVSPHFATALGSGGFYDCDWNIL